MSLLIGEQVGRGTAYTVDSKPLFYTIVVPQKNVFNLATMGAESARWKAIAKRLTEMAGKGQMDAKVAERARFADDVLALAGEYVRTGTCCVLAAQAYDGRVLGVMIYVVTGERAYIHLLAVDPEHLVGTPGQNQVRGVGTALVASVSRQVLRQGVKEVNLHPLDRAAEEFWRGRGFGSCGAGLSLCVRGEQIKELIDGCVLRPDTVGDVVVCGTQAMTEAARVPAYR